MTDKSGTTEEALEEIATLYELSLAIGTSLDIETNAAVFFTQFLSRLSLASAGLFVRVGRLQNSSAQEAVFRCVYSVPQVPSGAGDIPLDHPSMRRVQEHGIVEFLPPEVEQLRSTVGDDATLGDRVVGAALGDDIVVLFRNASRKQPYQAWQLDRLRTILAKFERSVDACLEYEMLVRESARRIELQERLIRGERLEALGLLAGGVAHDLNNLMMPLLGYPGSVREALTPGSDAMADLDAMELSAMRAAAVIDDLLVMARSGNAVPAALRISKGVRAYMESPEFLHLSDQHPRTRLRHNLDSTSQVRGSLPNIGRIVMNLLHNAYDALDGAGAVTVSTEDVEFSEPHRGYELIAAGSYCRVRVEDTGGGISESLVGRVFEPFVSTKTAYLQGTGLGLSVVYGMVKEMEGFVDVITSSAGTTFDVFLPLLGERPLLIPQRRRSAGVSSSLTSILIVDDDPEHLRWVSRVFEGEGIQVRVAQDRDSALRVLEEISPQVALIDLRLGTDDGVDLYRALLEDQPDLPCVLVSGMPDRERIAAGLRMGARGFLRKPYSPIELRRAVERVL